jgi:hypothetical protein
VNHLIRIRARRQKRTTANKPRFHGNRRFHSLCIFPPYPDYSQTLVPSHEKTVTATVERISRDGALEIYTKAALKVYCRGFNGDCVQRGENQIEKECLVTTQ